MILWGSLVFLFCMNVSYVSDEGGPRPDKCSMGTEDITCFWQW